MESLRQLFLALNACAAAFHDVEEAVGDVAGKAIAAARKSSEAELLQNLLQCEAMIGHDLTEDGARCAGAEQAVVGDGQVMFAAGLSGREAVRAELPDKLEGGGPYYCDNIAVICLQYSGQAKLSLQYSSKKQLLWQ
ncbi:MAG: hypothetical protein JWQ04_2422 [Pedosphaera sp.]|nr:hypothetical protein [Pedosphaera sp.]